MQTRLYSPGESDNERDTLVLQLVMFIYSRILNKEERRGEGGREEGGGLKRRQSVFRSSTSGFMFHYTVLNLFYSPFFYTESIQP